MKVEDPERFNHFVEIPGVVHCRFRELDRRDYFFIDVEVTHSQHWTMFLAASKYARDRIPFNQAGMFLNFVAPFRWFPIDRNETAFFCSELIMTLLHKAGILMDVRACTTSPNSLWADMLRIQGACPSVNRNSNMDEILQNLEIPTDYSQSYGGARLLKKK